MATTTSKTMTDKQSIIKFLLDSLLLGIHFQYVMGEVQEYCNNEVFSPSCGPDEVINISSASYGRMRSHRCIKSTTGLGCYTDVTIKLDEICSDKNSCEFIAVMELSTIQTPCPDDMIKYLEVEYNCVKVFQMQHSQCRSSGEIMAVTSDLSLSSTQLSAAHCGSASLRLDARHGQTLNVSIIDFSARGDSTPPGGQSCDNYAEIRESPLSRSTPVCAGAYGRHGHVMTTGGAEITLILHILDPRNQKFILQFQAIGCADITPPDGTWVQRSGAETILGCHSGSHSWTLTCVHNRWTGAVGSCGTDLKVVTSTNEERVTEIKKEHLAPGVLAFAGVSALLFLCSSSFLAGVCVHTARLSRERKDSRVLTLPLVTHQTLFPHHIPETRLADAGRTTGSQRGLTQKPASAQESQATVGAGLAPGNELYCNTAHAHTDSLRSDSVKYYVLEGPAD